MGSGFEIDNTDQILEIYISGSMALPMGVALNHGALLVRAHDVLEIMQLLAGTEIAATMPMFGMAGLMMFPMPCWEIGSSVLCTENTSTNTRAAMGSVMSDEDREAMSRGAINWPLGITETLGPCS